VPENHQPSSFDSQGSREYTAQSTREIYDDWPLIIEPFLGQSDRLARLRPRSWGEWMPHSPLTRRTCRDWHKLGSSTQVKGCPL